MRDLASSADPDFAPDGALLVAYANGDLSAAQTLATRLAPRALAQAARMLSDRTEA